MKAHNGHCHPRDLTPFERNSRVHTDTQIDAVAASITEFGFTRPVIVDEDNMILAGHCATRAALKLDLDKVPYRRISGLTDEQKRAYVIADNRIGDMSAWDKELLTLELEDLKSLDYDLKTIGFNEIPVLATNSVIGEGRFLLQVEFVNEKDMEVLYNELDARGLDIKVLE